MGISDLNLEVARFLEGKQQGAKGVNTGVPGLIAYETDKPSQPEATLYVPIVCLTLQGAKETALSERTRYYRAGESAIVSHDLPVVSRITKATPKEPYRALVLFLDLGILRSLHDQLEDDTSHYTSEDPIAVGATDPAFGDAMARYFALSQTPSEIPVMAPLIQRELHYRLLKSANGLLLRRLVNVDSHASRITRAIAHLRSHYRAPIAVSDLARIAGMGASSFHARFREITETTPLQYQKDLRLIEAHRLISEEGQSVSSTAFDVGYESPTQFSREFSRKFGAAPSQVGAALQASV